MGNTIGQKEWNLLREIVFQRDNYSCQICEMKSKLVAHHKRPRRHGGSDTAENLITLCRYCHYSAEKGVIARKNLDRLRRIGRDRQWFFDRIKELGILTQSNKYQQKSRLEELSHFNLEIVIQVAKNEFIQYCKDYKLNDRISIPSLSRYLELLAQPQVEKEMRWKANYRAEWQRFEYICEHGVGHYQPSEDDRHGCCNQECCKRRDFPPTKFILDILEKIIVAIHA